MENNAVVQLIEDFIEGSQAQVEGDGHHFQLNVISEQFANKTRVQQQQLVYKALAKSISDGQIHAVSIACFTPDGWKQAQKTGC